MLGDGWITRFTLFGLMAGSASELQLLTPVRSFHKRRGYATDTVFTLTQFSATNNPSVSRFKFLSCSCFSPKVLLYDAESH